MTETNTKKWVWIRTISEPYIYKVARHKKMPSGATCEKAIDYISGIEIAERRKIDHPIKETYTDLSEVEKAVQWMNTNFPLANIDES